MRISKTIWQLLTLPWSIITRILSWIFLGGGLVFFLLGIGCLAISDALRREKEWSYVDEITERFRIEQTSQHLLWMAKTNGRRAGSPSHLPPQPFHYPDE